MRKSARKNSRWTVARLAALLGRLERKPTLQELRDRYGLRLITLVRLNGKVLGTVEDTGVTKGTDLTIHFDRGVAFSHTGPLLEKAASLSRAELHLALTGLRWVLAESAVREKISALVSRMQKEGKTLVGEDRDVFCGPLMSKREADVLLAVVEARRGERKISFRYKGGSGGDRVVRPLNLRKDAGEWRLLAWDEGRKGLRVFKRVHMSEAKVFPEGFEWPEGVDKEEALARDLSVYRPSGREQKVELRMRANVFRALQHLFPDRRAPRSGDAWTKTVLLSTDPEWVARTLAPHVGGVKVLSPPAFRQAFDDELQAILSKYR